MGNQTTGILRAALAAVLVLVLASPAWAGTYEEKRVYEGWQIKEVFDAVLVSVPAASPWKLRKANPQTNEIVLTYRAITVHVTFEQLPERKVRVTFSSKYAGSYGKHAGDMRTITQQGFALLEARLQQSDRTK